MNRRTVLRRLAAGAAAIVGAGMVAPRVGVAEASEVMPTLMPGERWELTGGSAERAVIYENDPLTLHLRAGEFTAEEVNAWMATSGARHVRGAGMGQAIIHGPDMLGVASVTGVTRDGLAPAFEAMAADCGARGCWLESQYDIRQAATLVHHWPSDRTPMTRPDEIYVDRRAAIDVEGQIDAWRRSLHEDTLT